MRLPAAKFPIALAATLAVAAAIPASAKMDSVKLADGTCQTIGGGKIVAIPGFPGEKIDRRLLTDIRWLKRRYPIFITDGYSMSDVHAASGEHPLGLALDIVPDKAAGGTWQQITALARWAEPRQNRPRAPFRWVGYDGDENHGRRHHLHLSWGHSPTKPGTPARTVYTVRCPQPAPPPVPPPPEPEPEPDPPPDPSGGVGGDGSPSPSGGVGGKLAPVVAERNGVSAGS
jgi:hypothetical protein